MPTNVNTRRWIGCGCLPLMLAGCVDTLTAPDGDGPAGPFTADSLSRPIVLHSGTLHDWVATVAEPSQTTSALTEAPAVAGTAAPALGIPAGSVLELRAGSVAEISVARPEHGRGDRGEAAEVLRWNQIARELVARTSESPPRASRLYALLSVAQHDALTGLRSYERAPRGRPDSQVSGGVRASGSGRGPSGRRFAPAVEDAAVAGASAAVLARLVPAAEEEIGRKASAARNARDPQTRKRLRAAYEYGMRVGRAVVEYAATDGSDTVWKGDVPVGEGMWYSSSEPEQPPLLPAWGRVRPWFLDSGNQFRPEPPPAFGSPAFLEALTEVRHYTEALTPEQRRIAVFWADGAGTVTPPGHWNEIAVEVIGVRRLDALRAARVLAYMNMAVMDAGISCWDAKFAYWLIRPNQADPAIELAVGLPNFPAYTSGHSSFSGAAATVLGHFFPDLRRKLNSLAEEAAISRLYGGIHYRFDSEVGLWQGREVGRLAMEHARRDLIAHR